MLTCKEITEFVTDYLEGRMPFTRRLKFCLHLGMCDRCRAYLRQMKMTVRTLGKLPDEPIPPDVREELLARFRDMQPARSAVELPRRRPVAALDSWLRVRGWMLVGFIVLGAALLGLGGEHGPMFGGMWGMCVLMEVGAAALPVVAIGVVASRTRERLSAGALAAIAAVGGFLGFLFLPLTCADSQVAPHVLVVHVGGIVLAAALGASMSRVPALAHR